MVVWGIFRSMAVNSNESRWSKNRHTSYLATSGGGKGSMLAGNPDIPKPSDGARIVVWDRVAAFPAYYYESWNGFVKAYEKALNSGKGFAIGYTGSSDRSIIDDHERWAGVVWSNLDGNYETTIIDEEVGGTQNSIARKNSSFIACESRKFGAVWHGTAQRTALVPNAFLDNCGVYYVGRQMPNSSKGMASLIGYDGNHEDLRVLQNGEFLRYEKGVVERGRYREIKEIVRKRLKGEVIRTTHKY